MKLCVGLTMLLDVMFIMLWVNGLLIHWVRVDGTLQVNVDSYMNRCGVCMNGY